MINKGTYEGTIEEIQFVKKFNSNKDHFKSYLSQFQYKDSHLWMVRVTSQQLSRLNNNKVPTRADCYLVKIDEDISKLLEQNDYFLSEEILDDYIVYEKIFYSGVSVKMTSSNHYQILKLVPNSFFALFNSYELGAGASLFCMKEYELSKNIEVISGWNTTCEKMVRYFYHISNGNSRFYLDKDICKNIKNYSCSEIKRFIINSSDLQKKIFNGIGLYDEPYTAHYFYHGIDIEKLTTIDFSITTGSGRSKGDYTIVLKPR